MSNDWRYPIMIFHKEISIEVINSLSDTYHYLKGHPSSFVGEEFIDSTAALWKITSINILGGRSPNNGWRFPWSKPPGLFIRELNYSIEAEKIRNMSLHEVSAIILQEVKKSELWSERIDAPTWMRKADKYTSIEQFFNDFRRGRRRIH